MHSYDSSSHAEHLPQNVDILIVGAGPAGLLLATQIAQIPGVSACLIDKHPHKLLKGHADGLQIRSLEIFQALGIAHQVIAEACHINEMAFWEPDGSKGIRRADLSDDAKDDTSEMPHVILTQARLHEILVARMASSVNPLRPHYGCSFLGATKRDDRAQDALIQTAGSDHGGQSNTTITARFIVGCDGAHSTVRSMLGFDMTYTGSMATWGVMDAIADTDFPDIRRKAAIRSADDGAILLIPKAEENYMTSRIYLELGEDIDDPEKVDSTIAKKAEAIFKPFYYHLKHVVWSSTYQIGQGLCHDFDNATEERPPDIFIAGDACHTHSPKAGQGMNCSMADAFNLGWKLAAVVRGTAKSDILRSYALERHAVAQELIEFDKRLAGLFSSNEQSDEGAIKEAHERKALFAAGLGTTYSSSPIQDTTHETSQATAKGFGVGQRFHSAPVVRCSDGHSLQLAHQFLADGRWRIVVFAGADDPTNTETRTHRFLDWLGSHPKSPVRRFTPSILDTDAIIETVVVYRVHHTSVDLNALPHVLQPARHRFGGVRDLNKVFTSVHKRGDDSNDIYALRSVDPDEGAVVVVRPDQYVARVSALEDTDGLSEFFARFMLKPST